MDDIQIGQDGPQIAPLGIGTWAWGDRLFWGWGGEYGEDEIREAFQAALDAGIRLFDTAEIYGFGNSERLLGRFAAKADEEIVVASKFFPYPWRLTRASLPRAARASLRRLGRQQIDLYQLHWPTPLVGPERWMEAMADAVEAGLVKQVGVSNYGRRDLEAAHRALQRRGIQLASNQISYSLMQRGPELNGLLELCRELGVTVIAYSPLAQGLLTGKYGPEHPPSGVRRWQYGRPQLELAQRLSTAMRTIGEEHGGKTPAQVALNWCIAKGTVPIPGAKNPRQARDNAGALGWLLAADEVAQLDVLSRAK